MYNFSTYNINFILEISNCVIIDKNEGNLQLLLNYEQFKQLWFKQE